MAVPGAPDGGSGSRDAAQPTTADVDFDCCCCADVLVDPIVATCGHDFCKTCLEAWVQQGHATCPVCRACLPIPIPAVCLRLKEAVEAVAGQRVAERRKELEVEVAERGRRRQEDDAAAARLQQEQEDREVAMALYREARAAERAAPRAAERAAPRAAERAERASIRWQAEMAAQLPVPQGALPPAAAQYPPDRLAEESRWLSYQLGWPQMAAAREAANPQLFAREAALQREAAQNSVSLIPDPSRTQRLREQLEEASVQRQLALMQALPPGLPAPPPAAVPAAWGQPELSFEESRWRYLQAAAVAQQQHAPQIHDHSRLQR